MNQLARHTRAAMAILAASYTQLRFLVNPGLGGWSGKIFVPALVAALAVLTWGEGKFLTWLLSWVSFLSLIFWWFMFVSIAYRVTTKTNLHLTPRLRLVVGWVVILTWLALALLFTTGFFLGRWFFVAVGVLWLATLIPKYRRILLPLALLGIALACWFTTARQAWFMPSESAFDQLKTLVGMCAVAGSFLALVGVSRVFPLVGGALWLLWVGSILFSKPLTGLRFSELLSAIYSVGGQATTHVVTALALFGLMLSGIIFKLRREHRQGPLLNVGEGQPNGWGETQWQKGIAALPGYDYFLARAIRLPFRFGRLLVFSFGRAFHWTTFCWMLLGCGLLAALIVWTNVFQTRHAPSAIDASPILVMMLFICLVSALTTFVVGATYRARRSHQLLSLAPLWQEAPTLNRELAGMYARYCSITMAAGLVPICVVVLARDLGAAAFCKGVFVLIALGTLQFSALLRNYDVDDSMTVRLGMLAWHFATMVPAIAFALTFVSYPIPFWAALIALILGITLANFRYRRFVRFERLIPAAPLDF